MKLSHEQVYKLDSLKRQKRIKNYELADELGVSQTSISRYFNFKSTLSDEKEARLIKYINERKIKILKEIEVDF